MNTNASNAGRAMGAMFMAGFGSLWILSGLAQGYAAHSLWIFAAVAVGLGLFVTACAAYLPQRQALRLHTRSEAGARMQSRFRDINLAQWVAIALVPWGLSVVGRPQWITPAIVAIVGLHFFPVAALFKAKAHWVTGAALVLLVCVYPLLARYSQPNSAIAIAAGAVLWLSALNALVVAHRRP